MKLRTVAAIFFALSAMTNKAASASEADIPGQIESAIIKSQLIDGVKIEKVVFSKRVGLWEVVTPRGVFYTDKMGSFLIFGGVIVDTKTKKNLTQERIDELGAFDFKSLPLDDAIKTVRGDGSRKIVTFEDPNCGYCKKLFAELQQLNNVTIYTFLIPILSPDSALKSKLIWCAGNRNKVWADYMTSNVTLTGKDDCPTPLDRNLALQQKLRIMGTPAILFEDNSRISGYVAVSEIENRLATKK